ncbi:flagellar motor switch phosphatase FliY [Waltera intestinalis]|uniref:Flagellar motor switch phosphatase FliY n=1 Tax=Waltera intestinalis TaxID=2606635 RepID=A0A6L5YHB2_9FIRM|nr:flagellar motor switch phosphatase FliY [Waltera intestinalis]MST57077.1 flagellar motor switch phosphatase FliY [Waltera intestinalis]
MDGMLSQDEINALLQGMDLSDTADSGASPETPQDSSSAENTDNGYVKDVAPTVGDEEGLTDVEKDAIGEVANISMGSSATTLYSLVNRKVNITTPVVTLATWKTLLDTYEKPCVFIQIKYTQGLDGTNILVLKEHDVKVITDLMMGGDGTNTEGELGELHLSAISEAMNQMMGSAATSLSTLLQTVIDISPPESSLFDLTEVKDGKEISPFLGGTFVKISFRMQIDDLVDSTIMQLYPIDFARKLVETFINTQMANIDEVTEKKPAQPENDTDTTAQIPAPGTDNQTQMNNTNLNGMNRMGNMGMNDMNQMNNMGMNDMNQMNNMGMNGMNQMGNMGMNGMNQMGSMGMNGMNQMGNMGMNGMNQMGNMGMNSMNQMGMMGMPGQNVNVQPAQFQSFSNDNMGTTGQENIGLIKDVPLEVTVELGRTTKSISDILDFSPGTIIELDRIAGEPIDVLVNGKFVAKGEVVVIEESFGVRITEIIK